MAAGPSPDRRHSALGVDRAACFWQSVRAISACTTSLLALAPSDVLGISFIQFAQLARCIVVLKRLTTLDEPAWDRAAVRALVDLPVVLDRMADKLERAAAEAGASPTTSTLSSPGCCAFLSGMAGQGRSGGGEDEDVLASWSQPEPNSHAWAGSASLAQGQMGMMNMISPFGFMDDSAWMGDFY